MKYDYNITEIKKLYLKQINTYLISIPFFGYIT